MAVLSGLVPTLYILNLLWGTSYPSKAALCKTNLAVQKETLSFHSRSQNVKMLGLLSGREKKGQRKKDGRGGRRQRGEGHRFHMDHFLRTKGQ